MSELIRYALLGLGTGGIYALMGLGVVLIYRGSGVVNFSHGAMALLAASVFVELRDDHELPTVAAAVVAVAVAAVIGALVHVLVMRRLRSSSPLARIVATLGILAILQSAASIRYGTQFRVVRSFLPSGEFTLLDATVGWDRVALLAIGVAITVVATGVYRYTDFGRATAAVAESERSAAAAGVSPDAVAALNWAAGGALAGLAGVLIVPFTSLTPAALTLLILPALAAALVGSFRSFPLTLLAALAIGVAESEMGNYVSATGWSSSAPFLVIVAVLVFRGRSLPVRGFLADRLPAVAGTRQSPLFTVTAFAAGTALIFTASTEMVNAVTTTLLFAMLALSVVVVTGMAGQISLAQAGFAGVGALVAARLADVHGLAFPLAFVLGVACAVPIGVLFGLPALRTRGINLAIVTLGLSLALERIVFQSRDMTGGFAGTTVEPPSIFGWSIDSITHPERFSFVSLVLFMVGAALVVNLRSGRAGRRLAATRANERAATALGISVVQAKLYAFALAAAIAAAGGALRAFRYSNVRFDLGYSVFDSIQVVLVTFLGGVGYVGGALFGAAIASGGVITELVESIVDFNRWAGLVVGVTTVLMVMQHPNGLFDGVARLLGHPAVRRLTRSHVRRVGDEGDKGDVQRVPPATLDLSGVTVRFGGVVALRDVGIAVGAGEVVGLIGPNGAGKTTLIDAISGFTRCASGRITLNDADITSLSALRRARRGISRTFQNLELFEDLTVGNNLRAASDPRDASAYLTDLVFARQVPLSAATRRAVDEFGLTDDLDRLPDELSFGKRRLLAIARAVATTPSVVLLDEPAAGLDEQETAELSVVVRALADTWGMAVLLVEHDMSMVMRVCDRVVVLDDGKHLAEGSPAEVQVDPAVVAAYLGVEERPAGPAIDAEAEVDLAPSGGEAT